MSHISQNIRERKGRGPGQSVKWLGHGLDDPGLVSRQGKEVFLLSKAFRSSPGGTQPPIQWLLAVTSLLKAVGAW